MTGLASKAQLRMSLLRSALVTVPAVLLLGTLSSALAGADNGWFAALSQLTWIPPGWAFDAAWTLGYVLLGLSLAMVLHALGAKRRDRALALFAVQVALAVAWPLAFFAFRDMAVALSILAAMLVGTVALILVVWRIRVVAGLLLYPWLGWLMFVAMLSYQLLALNQGAELAPQPASTDIVL